ncbi:hypothetical protein [Paeniglutamicibacter cryotolerans]|uniref:Uncharacterized protein n=1 Tax=Paeniglutamicibacter cryotolerans TaxID=670079 RepID=A0A839QFW8_9MICC|nr:hypothetical protein [Paeniglutamicibacter cryotolerans]MBB2995049.1 hypothetical protein [Paeniglutamicibacter cryotolerans]
MSPSSKSLRAIGALASAATLLLLTACSPGAQANPGAVADYGTPVSGGTLTYLEYQAPTCLYLPAASTPTAAC